MTSTYTWDAESRLVGLTKPGLTTSYGYNGLDARTSRTVAGTTTTYKRAGAYVTDPVLNETTGQFSANYTPGVSERRAGVSIHLPSFERMLRRPSIEIAMIESDQAVGHSSGVLDA